MLAMRRGIDLIGPNSEQSQEALSWTGTDPRRRMTSKVLDDFDDFTRDETIQLSAHNSFYSSLVSLLRSLQDRDTAQPIQPGH